MVWLDQPKSDLQSHKRIDANPISNQRDWITWQNNRWPTDKCASIYSGAMDSIVKYWLSRKNSNQQQS